MLLNRFLLLVVGTLVFGSQSKTNNNSLSSQASIAQTNKMEAYSGVDSCVINLSDTIFKKEYNCSLFSFKYNGTSVYSDTNFEYTTYYYPVINLNNSKSVFDLYDSPTGRRRLLLFNIENNSVFLSDWFDNNAAGDSIDVESIDFKKKTFKVWNFKPENNRFEPYIVKLNFLKSW